MRYFLSCGGEICISFQVCVSDAVCCNLIEKIIIYKKIEKIFWLSIWSKIFCRAMGNSKRFDIYLTESGQPVNSICRFFFLRTWVAAVFFALFFIDKDINIRSIINFFDL